MGFDYRTYTGLGKQTFGGHKQNLMGTRIQKKGGVTPQETDPDLPVSVQESPVEAVGWWWPAAGSRVLCTAVHGGDLLKEAAIIFITSTIVWPQAKQQEGTQPISRKLD